MPQRSYSYARISQGKQARGDGLRRQQGKLDEEDTSWPERISQEQGWTLDDTLKFTDKGRSGFHQRNLAPKAALTKFLKHIESGRIARGSVLLIDKLDRLSRAEIDEAYDLFRGILRAGVWICTKEPFRIYRDDAESSFMDVMEPLWLMYLNWQESKKKSDNVGAAWQAARHGARKTKRPIPTQPPCWLERADDGTYLVNHERVAIVRRLARLARRGVGMGTLAAQMVEEKVPPLGRAGTWLGPAIYQLLVSRTLIGEYHPHRRVNGKRVPDGDPIPGFYPPALTEDEFNDTRAALTRRRKNRGRPGKSRINIFVGLLWEATQRHKLCMQTPNSHGIPKSYLSRGQIKGCVRVRYEALEGCVLDTLAMLRPRDVMDRPEDATEREHQIASLTARVNALSVRQSQLQAMLANPDQDVSVIAPALQAVSDELKAKSKERDVLKLESRTGRGEALAEAQSVRELREGTTGDERAELDRRIQQAMGDIVSSIWVQVQKVSERHQIVHVQIWLCSGAVRNVPILPPNLHGQEPWQLDGWDLRRGPYRPGKVGNAAGVPEAS